MSSLSYWERWWKEVKSIWIGGSASIFDDCSKKKLAALASTWISWLSIRPTFIDSFIIISIVNYKSKIENILHWLKYLDYPSFQLELHLFYWDMIPTHFYIIIIIDVPRIEELIDKKNKFFWIFLCRSLQLAQEWPL